MTAKMSSLFILCLALLLFTTSAAARQRAITADELIATYTIGHSFGGSSLTLAADGRYKIESSDCTTAYHDSGTYTYSEGVLRFSVLKKTAHRRGDERETNMLDAAGRKEIYGVADEAAPARSFKLMPVRWSERLYLMDADDLDSFAGAINLGLEPRASLSTHHYYGAFYLRDGDERKKVEGSPSLPEKQRALLLDTPVTATILSVEKTAKGDVAIIDKGSRDKLRIGMRMLGADEEPSPWSGAEVVAVEEGSSRVKLGGEMKAGDKLSTKYEPREYR